MQEGSELFSPTCTTTVIHRRAFQHLSSASRTVKILQNSSQDVQDNYATHMPAMSCRSASITTLSEVPTCTSLFFIGDQLSSHCP